MKEPEKNIRVHPDFEDKESFEEGVDKMYNQQSMRERFEEEFGKDQYGGKQAFRQVFVTPFIEKEIQLALKEQREETVEMIEGVRFGYEPPYEGQTDELMENQWEDNVILLNKLLTNLNQEKL